jgi:hypothetical protein
MMAFFCPKTGKRLQEPGISKEAGGEAEDYVEKAKSSPPKGSTKKVTPKGAAKIEEKD